MRDCFIKFSREKRHLSDFVRNGRIYINTAEFFSKCEDNCHGQNDKFELVTSYHQNKGALIGLAGREFKITKPFGLREGELNYSHIFCLYALSDESINRSKIGRVFSEKLWDEFGEYFVFIHDACSFMRRLDMKLKEMEVRYKADYVEYFCPNTYEGKVGAFKKRSIYSHQEEFRIAIDKPNVIEPISDLYLGDLSDIAYGPVHRSESKNLYYENRVTL